MANHDQKEPRMAFKVTHNIRAILRMLIHLLLGALVGMVIFLVWLGLDYLRHTDRQFWWIDLQEGIITYLVRWIAIGATSGFWWAWCDWCWSVILKNNDRVISNREFSSGVQDERIDLDACHLSSATNPACSK